MKERCFVTAHPEFANYGGRGITVYDEWQHSFSAFFQYIGPRPSKLHSLDRIDTNGDYVPGNVRWATALEQSLNTRRVTRYSHDGKALTIRQWAEHVGMKHDTLRMRITRLGWPLEIALTKSVGEAHNTSGRTIKLVNPDSLDGGG